MKITPDNVRRMMAEELDAERERLKLTDNAAGLQRAVQRLTWAIILAVFVALLLIGRVAGWH